MRITSWVEPFLYTTRGRTDANRVQTRNRPAAAASRSRGVHRDSRLLKIKIEAGDLPFGDFIIGVSIAAFHYLYAIKKFPFEPNAIDI